VNSQPNSILRSALLLGLVAVIGTGILSGIHAITKDRIEKQQQRFVLEQLNQVLPSDEYDNELHLDKIEIIEPSFFRQEGPIRIYRARKQSSPVALIMNLVAPDGYNGDIRLLVAIRKSGELAGVRVVTHRETPGLGDPIEHGRSNWILSFNERSLVDPEESGWAVKRDGGIFDQFTGATITPRAVVETVERALKYFSIHQARLFEQEVMESDHVTID
jgi:electron transport complex protein RnfG